MSAEETVAASKDILRAARSWIASDPDPQTRAELAFLVEAGDLAALRDRFDHPLSFGTAGLRAELGAGPARMNRAVVRKTTAGLAAWLSAQGREVADAGVVVAHDARHGSAAFAADTARVLAASGVRARYLTPPLPTPLCAFAVSHLGASAGVMVTASHNPAPDNGYKVYAADGAQVVPPDDAAIARRADEAAILGDDRLEAADPTLLEELDTESLLTAYRTTILGLLEPGGPRQLRAVYTPVHGVGGAVLPALLVEAGFPAPVIVPEQAAPDPDFPTAPFPNPEEPGVLDLALALGTALGADVVLANDPDADRLAVALPDPATGALRALSGDQLGTILGDHLMSHTSGPGRLVASSLVSSSMLGALADAAGVAHVETLTGFKWVARAALRRPGHRLIFGYEEALGYAVSDAVADKDGISAALLVADMAARAKAEGRSLLDRLDELEARFGVHATSQWNLRLRGSDAPERLAAAVARWRAAPPERLAGLEVTEVRDLKHGDGELSPSNMLILRLGTAGRVILRPSGTEPKLKAYLEAVTAPPGGDGLAAARRQADETIAALRHDVGAALAD